MLDDLVGLLTGEAAAGKATKALEDIQSGFQTGVDDLSTQLQGQVQFQPFTVKTAQGNVQATGGGNLDFGTSPVATGLQTQAQQGLSGLGQTYDASGLQQQAFGGAQTLMGQGSGQFAGQLGGLYAGLGEQQIANAQSPAELQRLQTAMTTQGLTASGQPSQGLTGLQGLTGQADFSGAGTDVTGAYSGISAPNVRTGAGDFSQGLLAQAQQGLSGATPTAQSVYEQIRATQSPEEERQRIALENRLAAQGRLGVQTDMYGTTPEEFAMNKAQAEARNAASLQAMSMADQLASSQQARATQLGQLGLSGEQIQAQLDSEGFGQEMSLRGANIQAQQAQSDLESASQARASQLAQLGMSAEQIASQLQSEGLSRQQSSAQLAAQLAQTGAGISAQEQQLGQGLLGLGLQAQQLGGQLGLQDTQQAATLFGLGQQATSMPYQEEAMQLQNIQNMLTAAGIPQQQQIQALAPAIQLSGQEASQNLGLMNALSQLGQTEIGGMVDIGQALAAVQQERIKAGGTALSGLASGVGGLFS